MTVPETALAAIGLGYVGLPLAVAFTKHRPALASDPTALPNCAPDVTIPAWSRSPNRPRPGIFA